MLIGYARVSTDNQNLDLQKAALANAGCDLITLKLSRFPDKRKEVSE
jgi:DNA invertase Pin-like site-specific DNA recombinase